tara:strand:+ start:102 stop:983 length:882 start_codon:yes stop_codon:yes gene_type:complete
MKLNTLINSNKIEFNKFYNKLLNKHLTDSILGKAMKYASTNGGKRIRPYLVSEASNIVKLNKKNMMILASCIESIHSYSLIHDDLPSMDNDDFRRGKLSTHKKFNEATAILAGDALHDFAFELISGHLKNIDLKTNLKLINYLSKSTGHIGLAGGQSLDLLYENSNVNLDSILEMYKKKTGKLFEFSFSSPFILKNETKKRIDFSKKYGLLFGQIFQIIDDLLDEINSFKKIGKTPGKDKKQGKSTLLNLIGEEKIIDFCKNTIDIFINKNKDEFKKYKVLESLLKYNLTRLN